MPEKSSGPSAQPVRIGPWTVHYEIGAGGMARVFFADRLWEDGKRQIAVIKVPNPELLVGSKRKMFDDEVRVILLMNHPNIVPVFDVGVDEGLPYFAMAFIPGRNLSELIKAVGQKRIWIDERLAAYVTLQVAYALKYAHDFKIDGVHQGIIHRDIAAKNVMLSGDGSVHVTDFGVAKTIESEASLNSVKGTPAYMAPEHALGQASQASDRFGLGTILWSMLQGARFRYDVPREQMLKKAAQGYVTPLRRTGVSPGLRRVLHGLLHPDEDERMSLETAIAILEDYPSRRTALSQLMQGLFGKEVKRSGHTKMNAKIPESLLNEKELARTRQRLESGEDAPSKPPPPAPPTLDVPVPAALSAAPIAGRDIEQDASPRPDAPLDATTATPVLDPDYVGRKTPPTDRLAPLDQREEDAPVAVRRPNKARSTEVAATPPDRPRHEASTPPAIAPTTFEQPPPSPTSAVRIPSTPTLAALPRHGPAAAGPRRLSVAALAGLGACVAALGALGTALVLARQPRATRAAEPAAPAASKREPPLPTRRPAPPPEAVLVVAAEAESAAEAEPAARADPAPALLSATDDSHPEPQPSTAAEPASPAERKPSREAARSASTPHKPPGVSVTLGLGFVDRAEIKLAGKTYRLTREHDSVTFRTASGVRRLQWRINGGAWNTRQWSLGAGCRHIAMFEASTPRISAKCRTPN